jgi:hypothetical protein
MESAIQGYIKQLCAALSCVVQEDRPFQKAINMIDLLTENAQENIRNHPAQGGVEI